MQTFMIPLLNLNFAIGSAPTKNSIAFQECEVVLLSEKENFQSLAN